MILYSDLVSGDEYFADANPHKYILNDFFIEAESKWKEVGGEDVDIGANPSAEGVDEEDVDNTKEKVIDLVYDYNLQSVAGMDKKLFKTYFKQWAQKIAGLLEGEKLEKFKAGALEARKYIEKLIDDDNIEFYYGPSYDEEGSYVFTTYKDGAHTPTFLYPVLAMKEQKL